MIRSVANSPEHLLLAARMEQTDRPAPLRALTTGLAQGDDAAWTEFHRAYGPTLFRRLLGSTQGDYDLAGEALQQTYLRVARYARPCDSEVMFQSWLSTVANSVLNDCRRRRKRFWGLLQRPEAATETFSPEVSAAQDERVFAALEQALTLLTPDERQLLQAKYFSGTEVRQLAAQLGLTPKAVESRLTRARVELRRHLAAALSRHE